MSNKIITELVENRTADNFSPILGELEVTESEEYVLYVDENVGNGVDEVHVFPADENLENLQVVEAVGILTGGSSSPIRNVHFQKKEDERLVFQVEENQTPEGCSSGQEVANHILNTLTSLH